MNGDLVQRFVDHGFVKLEQAFPADVAEACAQLLWAEIGVDAHNPASWSKPVYWVGDMAQEPFKQAANTPPLHDAFDALVGPGRWAPRASLGSFPLRFPHPDEPDDAGWHVEGSYQPPGANNYWLNMYSTHRALLMLFLFTEVDTHNAPTRIRVGSHMDIPATTTAVRRTRRVDVPHRAPGRHRLRASTARAGHRPARRRVSVPPIPRARRPTTPRPPAPVHGPATAASRHTVRSHPARRRPLTGRTNHPGRPPNQPADSIQSSR